MISLLALFVHEGTSQAYAVRGTEHPDYPGHCYQKDPYSNGTIILKAGTRKRQPYKCFSVECSTDYVLSIAGCGVQASHGHCRVIKGDLSKPYPHCCDEYIC
ncbi:uncharacterized protein CBL_02722 [Carabus blaptoides fortunei]